MNAIPPTPPGRPVVRVNMAMTADGKIATSTRSVHTFGSPRDGRHLYQLRAGADAILCGARTVEETEASLGNGGDAFTRKRLRDGRASHLLRVIVSGSASFSPRAALWNHRFSPIHLWVAPTAPTNRVARLRTLADEVWTSPASPLDLRTGLEHLAAVHGIRTVIVEGGGGLNDALFRADLIDEIHLTLCPLIFGGRTAPTISDGIGVQNLADASQFTLASTRRLGDEIFLIYRRTPGELPAPTPSPPGRRRRPGS